MERYMWWFDLQQRSPSARYNAHSNRQHFSGAMDESSGKVQRCKITPSAALSWILQLTKLATPLERTKTPPPCKPKSGARNVPSGRWNVTHAIMGSICGKAHPLPKCMWSSCQYFSGAMDESSGKGSMMQAHRSSGVIMDIATFKVSHSVGVDTDATALKAKKWSA